MPEISFDHYGRRQENHYSNAARELHGQISTAIEFSTLEAHPTYIVDTRAGERLRIQTFLDTDIKTYNDPYPNLNRNITIPELYLLAFDRGGKLVGHRWTQLRDYSARGYIEATGRTTVGVRGKGYATALELAHQQELQSVADRSKTKVLQVVGNENLINLKHAKMGLFNDPPEVIDALEEEQTRWLELYGSAGSLGYEDLGNGKMVRKFFPNDQPQVDTDVETVVLKRFDTTMDDGRAITGSLIEEVKQTPAPSEVRTMDLIATLRETVLSQLEILKIPPHIRKNL